MTRSEVPGTTRKTSATKDEHDEWVEAHGVPYTHRWMRHLDPPRRPAKKEE